ncbi:MAG: chemotaxis protein CheC [Oscillospiraceae bacterium]|nr:chemotaxis protein CheC [Oscillospiraceae bacterium]MCL2278408.1 chemotaxis protein CheC [Oscillospiraceae bacterium]
MDALESMNEIHKDVLREIANIGSGNAASSLSRMVGQTIDIKIPDIHIMGFNEAIDYLGGPETIMIGTLLFLTEGIEGMMMFLLPVEVVCDLVNMLMGTEITSHEEIDEMGYSIINECSNIMSASFVTAVAEMTDLIIDISPPEATLDMLGSIMSVPSIYFANIGDSLLVMKNELEIEGKTTSANVLMLPDMPSLKKLMSSLGIDF